MLAAIDVQHHPWQWSPRPSLAMFAALASGLHQTGTLQRLLHPGVTQLDVVLATQLLVKVPHVEIEVLLLVQAQYFLDCFQWYALWRRNAAPPIEQTLIAFQLEACLPTLHLPATNAEDLRGLKPGDPLGHRSQHDVL